MTKSLFFQFLFQDIIKDMDLTSQEKCEKILALSNTLSEDVRKEARIKAPKDCTIRGFLEKDEVQRII